MIMASKSEMHANLNKNIDCLFFFGGGGGVKGQLILKLRITDHDASRKADLLD